MKPGQIEKAEIDPRYVQLVMQNVIRDVFDALVELITNSDDSYHRLYLRGSIAKDGGPILIETERRVKDLYRILVRDRAEGMTLAEMREKIKGIGKRTSGDENRGFMGRGAKECAVLGRAIFESIKEGKYYKCEFNSNLEFIPYEPPEKATPQIRKKLHIPRGNGTVVTLEIGRQRRIPRFETIARDLPYHFALRDILSENSPTRAIMVDERHREPLIYPQPEGELKFAEEFEVPGYAGIKAGLKIWRSPEPLDGYSDRFRRNGIVIRGERAIHECSLLTDEFERDPLASRYFGRIECSYIDQLCREYDACRAKGESFPDHNFCLIIDPNRQKGLRRDHPFTKALFIIPSERIRTLIAADREKEKEKRVQVANEETRYRLDRLAKAAGRFLKQQLEEIEEITVDEAIDVDAFAKQGVLIYPTYFKVAVGEQKRLAVYVKSAIVENEDRVEAKIESEGDALAVIDTSIELRPHKARPDMFLGYFRIEGKAVTDAVLIEAAITQQYSATAVAQVVDTTIEEHIFTEPLEYEHNTYQVKEGKRRAIYLFAKYPEVVSQKTEVEVSSTHSEGVPVRERCELTPVAGSNFAYGDVIVQGRRLHARAEIRARINEYTASTTVKVTQTSGGTIPIRIELRDEDYGNFRAKWAEHEGQPNLLLISARHKSLSRYLGTSPSFEGQNKPHFKVILAEIVAESVCRKSLVLEARQKSWEFHWADEKEDDMIATSVLAELHRRMREFAVIAHSIMLEQKELTEA